MKKNDLGYLCRGFLIAAVISSVALLSACANRVGLSGSSGKPSIAAADDSTNIPGAAVSGMTGNPYYTPGNTTPYVVTVTVPNLPALTAGESYSIVQNCGTGSGCAGGGTCAEAATASGNTLTATGFSLTATGPACTYTVEILDSNNNVVAQGAAPLPTGQPVNGGAPVAGTVTTAPPVVLPPATSGLTLNTPSGNSTDQNCGDLAQSGAAQVPGMACNGYLTNFGPGLTNYCVFDCTYDGKPIMGMSPTAGMSALQSQAENESALVAANDIDNLAGACAANDPSYNYYQLAPNGQDLPTSSAPGSLMTPAEFASACSSLNQHQGTSTGGTKVGGVTYGAKLTCSYACVKGAILMSVIGCTPPSGIVAGAACTPPPPPTPPCTVAADGPLCCETTGQIETAAQVAAGAKCTPFGIM